MCFYIIDDFSISGELEEVISLEIPIKRETLLPLEEGSPELDPAFDQSRVSELCSCLLPGTAASEEGTNPNNRDTGRNSNFRAESKCQHAEEPKTDTKAESNPVPCASVTQEHVVSGSPKPLCSPWCQEFSKDDQNTDNLCEILTVSENMNIKYEKESACSSLRGNLQCDPFPSDSERERDCSEDILVKNLNESTSPSKSAGRNRAENGHITSGRGRKRRYSRNFCERQSSYLEQNGNSASSHSGESSSEVSVGNPQLFEDLSAALEQSFQRASTQLKVRRSTRLQGSLEDMGLVWMLPPTPPTSQKTKRRRTICAFDSRGFESMSSREETISSEQNPGALPSIPGSEGQSVGSSKLPGRRRKSVCVSTLPNAESTTEPPGFKRRSFLKKGESSQLP